MQPCNPKSVLCKITFKNYIVLSKSNSEWVLCLATSKFINKESLILYVQPCNLKGSRKCVQRNKDIVFCNVTLCCYANEK